MSRHPQPFLVAIDGPAGSGKSSVSRAAATELGFGLLDTGAGYRALTWAMLDSGADPEHPEAVLGVLTSLRLSLLLDPANQRVLVGERDVTAAIREPRVSSAVSAVARIPAVRERLNSYFTSLLRETDRPGVVIEGRDTTTVIAPDAAVRILLTAAESARRARRSAELGGEDARDAGEQLSRRDAQDSRVVDFLTAADGVTTVDSTELDFAETVAAVVALVRASAG